ncbi:S8 family serine peptidase [Bacillus sp. DX4.1]|uniref:S8 family serine peptidase n=1 Tax=Bacillus sp. DX4.1 TaxID=3055867 RepID=UPI0025A01CA9|nr:S8 family serine peptidase [Bacillus sp. DX4.1]MDM5188632.1 S8 family serine peptidase [Bacillus sp. DX4.1]
MKRKSKVPHKVIATAVMSAMLFTTTAFAENETNSKEQQENVEQIVKQGQQIFLDEKKKEAQEVKDKLGYEKAKKEIPPYAPSEKVRVIVEVQQPSDVKSKSIGDKKSSYKAVQDRVIAQIQKAKSNVKVKHRFYEGFNGFSMDTEFQNVKNMKDIPGVTNVHIAKTFQPSMGSSKELVQAQKVWEQYGYEGEGLLVAVVDSGIDHTHQDMKLTEKGQQKEKWKQENIQEKFAETTVNDVWYSDKVPTGYDWADEDTDVIPHRDPHGMHVAGTVGANGNEEADGVKGIAPGVQLLAEKVFSDKGGGAYEDDIIAGIEHAVTMEADVINMSLGSDAGFVGEENDPIQKTIRQATEQGTLVVVAGGNSAYSTKNSLLPTSKQPYAENADIGTVGEPGVSPYALSVASYENPKIHMGSMKSEDGFELPYKDQTQYNSKLSKTLSENESYEMVYVGEGRAEDFSGKDVNGKIVVAKPKQPYAFYSYIQNEAKKKGAKAVIVVPPSMIEDYPYLNFSPIFIPAVTTSKAVGDELIAKLTSGKVVKMKLTGSTWVENADKNTISDFSSFGAPHTLDFKPELSAPGGNIYSTVPGNEYEVMSGTSMAAPHVAGGSTLLLQALYEKGLSHSKDTALKAKLALMNTTAIVMDPKTNGQVPYSPRIQGSGLMQIQNAINTPVLVSNKGASLEQAGAVALKEIKGQTARFDLNLEALSENVPEEMEYTVYVDVLTDDIETKEFDLNNDNKTDVSKKYLTLTSKRVKGAYSLINGKKVTESKGTTIKIKRGQTSSLQVNLLLPKELQKNTFVEGYVRLIPTGANKDKSVPLTVPYMGFYGEWDSMKNLDPVAWDENVFLGYTVLWDDVSDLPLGYDPKTGKFNEERIAVSTRSIPPGIFSSFTTLRNLAKTEMYVENSKGERIKWLGDFSEYTGEPWKFRKNIMAYRNFSNQGYLWEVKDENGQPVPDGTYNYVIKTTLDYQNAKPQEVKIPVNVDSVAPVVSDIQVQPKNNGEYEISFKAEDNERGSGYNGAIVWYNGKYKSLQPGQKSLTVKEEVKGVVVMSADYAYNQGYTVWGDPSYINSEMLISFFNVYPNKDVNANTPVQITGYTSNRVDWKVYIKDEKGNIVDTITKEDEHTLRISWTPKPELPNGTYTVVADAVNDGGFKVTTEPKTFTVLQQ